MVEVRGFEIVIASFLILITAVVLSAAGLLEQGLTLFMFMSMGLVGFLAVRAIRGRKLGWR